MRPPVPTYVNGAEWEAVVSRGWRLLRREKKCRYGAGSGHKACGKPAVAEFDRSGPAGKVDFYAYCKEHLYNNWIEDGKILHWRVKRG